MHPKILERRKAVFMGQLEYVSPEEWERVVAGWVSHYEREFPRPENYRKKALPLLRKLLGKIDHYLEIVSKPGWGEMGENLSAMYGRHRGHVVKELARRMMVKKA
ncbi:MAG: hypothetical protein M1377_00280 [Deltaproteobacteria bacterium]|nr:hypothetical protein [Deltaproteobacteria bacterium]